MIGIRQAAQFFFDRSKVKAALDRRTRRVLSTFGAFVRRTARSSLRTRKRVSAPGSPPSSHTGLLKKFIFFGYDRDKRSVIIGPTKLNTTTEAPSVLEHGGTTMIETRRKKRKINISARPYMGPAFEKEKTKLPAMWRDSIR